MFRLFRYALLCLATLAPLSAGALGYTSFDTYRLPPSNLGGSTTFSQDETFTLIQGIRCYDGSTGDPLRCTFSFRVLGLAPGGLGGHEHDFDTHPITWPATAMLKHNLKEYPLLSGIPSTGDNQGVTLGDAGSDDPNAGEIYYVMPEVAGQPQVEMITVVPPDYYCPYASCYDLASWRDVITLDVGVEDLFELPATSFYSLCGVSSNNCAPDPNHPLTHSGTMLMNSRIASMAALYFTYISGNQLQINDVSLPKGGLFDIFSNWSRPHKTHRKGTAVDLNKTALLADGTKAPVDVKELKRDAVKAGLAFSPEIAPKCQSGTPASPCIHLDLIQ